MSSTRAQQLNKGLQQLDLHLEEGQKDSLLEYAEVLLQWNKRYNLIGQSTENILISRHLIDSLSVLPAIEVQNKNEPTDETVRWIDVGSGAGLPGIPLAIARPNIEMTLLDSNSKKTRFLVQLIAQLGLKNVTAVHSRVEDYQPAELFHGVLSRAWTALPEGLQMTAHLGDAATRWWFMKGQPPEQELLGVPKQFTLTRSVALLKEGEARNLFEFSK